MPATVLRTVTDENLEYTVKKSSRVDINSSLVYIAPSLGRGIASGPGIEIAPTEWEAFDKTNPSNYAFEHPRDVNAAILVLGLPSILNHSRTPNCRYQWDYHEGICWVLNMITLSDLKADTELTFDYECSWFDVV
jgi:hypothetical protein